MNYLKWGAVIGISSLALPIALLTSPLIIVAAVFLIPCILGTLAINWIARMILTKAGSPYQGSRTGYQERVEVSTKDRTLLPKLISETDAKAVFHKNPQREDHQRSLRPIEASSGSTARSAKETAAGILVEQEESNRDDSSQHGDTATQLVSIQHSYKNEDPGTSTEKIGSSFTVQEYTLMDADTSSSIPIEEVNHSTNGIDSHSSSQSCSPSQVVREGEKKHDVPVQVPSSSGKTVEVVQGLASDAPSSISQEPLMVPSIESPAVGHHPPVPEQLLQEAIPALPSNSESKRKFAALPPDTEASQLPTAAEASESKAPTSRSKKEAVSGRTKKHKSRKHKGSS